MLKLLVREVQRHMDTIFFSQSNCYHANTWFRKTFMDIMLRFGNEIILLLGNHARYDLESIASIMRKYTDIVQSSMTELERCDPNTKVVTRKPGKGAETTTVGEILRDTGARLPPQMCVWFKRHGAC